MKKWIMLWAMGNCVLGVFAQHPARVSEVKKRYTTYPFTDPDPIASAQKLYPYFRFDGFTNTAVEKDWNTVILENDYIRVQVMPEIGGKIWSAYDKVNKRDYIYNNGVVKFRDIAMRGPWTSGGIEANYGIIGHTPNTSTPVDYLTRENVDGSVSCFIHAYDMLSRSNWTLEIRLEKDKGYFSTRSFWSNANAVEQPYYTWMNLGVAAGQDLKFLYPGNHYIGHDGDAHAWPIDNQGRDLSNYKENAFGSSKSYHVLGAHSNAFGVYYNDHNYGMARYALREDKLGKKIFLWSQAGDGKIWENLLTDESGQYVEIQSGRLFNQNVPSSSSTPFKQLGFAPYQSDSWTEYWMPFAGIGKPNDIQLSAAIRMKQENDEILLDIDPKRPLNDSIYVLDSVGVVLNRSFIVAKLGEPTKFSLQVAAVSKPSYLKLGQDYFNLRTDESWSKLNRPTVISAEVSSDTSQTKLLEIRDLIRFRQYTLAEVKLQELAQQAPSSHAYLEMAKLAWFKMNYQQCYTYARQALAMDAYDAQANYYYGLAAIKLKKENDALDGFEVASLTPAWRSASYVQMAKYYYRIKQYDRSENYSAKALIANPLNIDALQMSLLVQHKKGDVIDTLSRQTILQYDPFNAFLQFEEKKAVSSRQEFASEKRMELAIWYADLGEFESAADLLSSGQKNTEALLWLAWLTRSNKSISQGWLTQAEQSKPSFVFPFREESKSVFEWAKDNSKSWTVDYLSALLYRFRNQSQKARELLSSVEQEPTDFAAYYALKSSLQDTSRNDLAVQMMQQATRVDPQEWRYGLHLVELLNNSKSYEEALRVSAAYHRKFPKNYILTLAHVRTLLLAKAYVRAEQELRDVNILPFEGATEGHRYYVQTKLMLAYQSILEKNYKKAKLKIAESRLWPINLGVGEPYAEEKNELLADWLEQQVQQKDKQGNSDLLKKIVHSKPSKNRYELMLRQRAEEQLKLSNGEEAAVKRDDLKGMSPSDHDLISQIKEGDLAGYWPILIRKIYFEQDQRLF
ncbi:DUF5107 domain-containing protein [Sphingobacterium multivorum]|uniref:DUF5107 domain-containing protein n=1 Tax=Sphingobacterium multivorum TaxID=28454 RepID=UPI0031BB947F